MYEKYMQPQLTFLALLPCLELWFNYHYINLTSDSMDMTKEVKLLGLKLNTVDCTFLLLFKKCSQQFLIYFNTNVLERN